MSRFRPLLPGGHLQTLGGVLARSFLKWPFPSEDVVVDAGRDVRLLLRASWQEKGADRPGLLLVHGLEGTDEAHYVVSAGVAAFRSGWHVIRMNMRGCGDSLSLCPELYNAGLTGDLLAAAEWLASRVARFAIIGFSLGAGLTLLTLARESIAFHSVGMLSKFYAEEFETAEEGILAAVRGTGATWAQTLRYGLFPQSVPQVVAFTVYRLEMNFRDAAVLGLVGAGGIGYYIQLYVRGFQYEKVAVLLLVIIAVVTVLDQMTYWVRRWVR